jgi:DtxR family transcriptional regulator, Mn-dependent transcriptional regulator
MRADFHPPAEEYLQAIELLAEEGTPVIQARLAERLSKSPPAVSEMLDRLAADGYIRLSRRQISLTPKGFDLAESVLRKHRLAERLLVDVIGLPWHKAHEEAGRLEHVISDDVEARLVLLLGDPATCPHGNRIPGSAHVATDRPTQFSLDQVSPPQTVTLERVTQEIELDPVTLLYLDEAGFIPGNSARVNAKAPDGTLMLEIGNSVIALGREVCRRLFVSVGSVATGPVASVGPVG